MDALDDKQNDLAPLIKETKKSREELKIKLEQGKDQLIEINSHSTNKSNELI